MAALAWRRGVTSASPRARAAAFPQKPGPPGGGGSAPAKRRNREPHPAALTHGEAVGAREGREQGRRKRRREEGLRRVMSSGSVMPKHLRGSRGRAVPEGLTAAADGRTDGRPLGRLRSCGRWVQRELSGAIWLRFVVADDSEVVGASRGCRGAYWAGGGGRSRVGRGSRAQRWVLQSEKKAVLQRK